MPEPFRCIRCESSIDPQFKACPYCGEPITDFLRNHATVPVDGKYEIVSRLGIGGMGEVFKVHHIHLNTVRVLKLMRPALSADADAHERFLREARLATRIHHPNVATLHDFARLGDGSFYMIWEYIDGRSLSDIIRNGGPIAPRRAARLAVQALHGLEAIHKSGIIHRDVSPDNIMIAHDSDGEERVKIIDLGIAKQGGDNAEQTSTGLFIGKLKYCSPEHLGILEEGERMDGRADIYSFGIVLYEMLTGVPPFVEEGAQQYFLSHARRTPRPLRTINPKFDASPELEAVIFRALEKERAKRFATAREFAAELERLIPTLDDSPAASQRTLMVAAPVVTATTKEATQPARLADTVMTTPRPIPDATEFVPRSSESAVRNAPHAFAPTERTPVTPHATDRRPLILAAIALALVVVVGAAAVTIWFIMGQARGLADGTTAAPATSSAPTVTATDASVMPGQSVSVEAPPLPTATETSTTAAPTPALSTAPPAMTPSGKPVPERPSRKTAEPPTETVAEEKPPVDERQETSGQTFTPGRGRRFAESKEYQGFKRGFLPDYSALTKGEGVQWSWVAPGVRLSQHRIRVGGYRNGTDVTGDTLMNWLTTEMQKEIDDVVEPAKGSLTANGMIYWAERSTSTKRGVGIEMTFRDEQGQIVAMLRHRIFENTPEDAAEEMAEAVADFVDENR